MVVGWFGLVCIRLVDGVLCEIFVDGCVGDFVIDVVVFVVGVFDVCVC